MEKIIIIDSNSVIHRAFHALPPLKNKKGEVVNAVYGYLTFLFKAIRELEPKYIAACFDVSKCTFRKDLYCDYKANRQKAPDELYYQIPLVKDVLKKFNISIFEKEGFEGDDLIGTISKKEIVDLEKIILSGDLDNLQLIDDFTKVFFLGHGINTADIFDEKKVYSKYGFYPKQVVDFKALKGDSSDNIPGVTGIGDKTAINLLNTYSHLEGIYENLDLIKGAVKEKLILGKEMAFLSKKLASIKTDVDFDFNLEKCQFGKFEKKEVTEMLEDFGFKSLIKRIPGNIEGDNLKLF